MMRQISKALIFLSLVSGQAAAEMRHEVLDSAALGREIGYMIYTPNTPPPASGWPVLYLLHGLGGDETDWKRLGGIEQTLDRMIADGAIDPLVAIMPNAASSWYVDSAAIGGPGDYEAMIVRDLLPAAEARISGVGKPTRRVIAGLSMGGFGALRLALAHPDLFSAVASMSGAIWQNVPQAYLDMPPEQLDLIAKSDYFHTSPTGDVTAEETLPPPGKHFAGAFGTPFDARFFNRMNVFTLLSARIADGRVPPLFLTVGDDDSHQLWRGAIAVFDTLRAAGLDASLRITDGDHTWALWRTSVRDALMFLDQQLGKAMAGKSGR